MAKKTKQSEAIPDLLPETQAVTDNKATAGTVDTKRAWFPGDPTPHDSYAVLIRDNGGDASGGFVSDLYAPDFEPRRMDVKTRENAMQGGLGALQAMHSRAALFAKQAWCVGAWVQRKSDGQVWQVDAGGYIRKSTETERETV